MTGYDTCTACFIGQHSKCDGTARLYHVGEAKSEVVPCVCTAHGTTRERIVVYITADLGTDEAYVNYGDEDKDVVIALLQRVLAELAGVPPDGAG